MTSDMLMPRKSQVTTIGILPNKRSQSAHYCLVWGIRPVCGPATVGEVTVKMLYLLLPSPPFKCIFWFYFIYDMQVPNLSAINIDNKEFTM